MSRSVIKFGGSDLKTSNDVQRIIQILHTYNRPVAVVFSAFYGITDMLIEALNEAEKGMLDIENIIDNIARLKQRTIEENISSKEEAHEAYTKTMVLVAELK
jgi:aspartokinase/homoserine dehydrogenase 1